MRVCLLSVSPCAIAVVVGVGVAVIVIVIVGMLVLRSWLPPLLLLLSVLECVHGCLFVWLLVMVCVVLCCRFV